jgi:hypothetical protein
LRFLPALSLKNRYRSLFAEAAAGKTFRRVCQAVTPDGGKNLFFLLTSKYACY